MKKVTRLRPSVEYGWGLSVAAKWRRLCIGRACINCRITFEVTALCDVSPMILEQLGKLWSVQTLTTDHRELVARSDVDVVLVANPNAFHAEVTLDAIAAGKHVLVEKPMCVTRREADQIVAAQKKSNVVVQVGYMRRYAPAFLEGCQVVKAMKEIKFARVRDFLGLNSLIIQPHFAGDS